MTFGKDVMSARQSRPAGHPEQAPGPAGGAVAPPLPCSWFGVAAAGHPPTPSSPIAQGSVKDSCLCVPASSLWGLNGKREGGVLFFFATVAGIKSC